jgi:hypothetical protein
MNQHKISQQNVHDAHLALSSFAQEFEMIYCQRQPTRVHFVRPCLHSLLHLPREVVQLGPPMCSSQWTLEHTIGNLGEEIKQHSNPFANLSQHGIWRSRVNALKAMIPDLDKDHGRSLPRGSIDIGDGFVLLHARDVTPYTLRGCEADALHDIFPSILPDIAVCRWARLRIPTGQNCYTAWKELQKPLQKRCTARNVKVSLVSPSVVSNTDCTYVSFSLAMKSALLRSIFLHYSSVKRGMEPSHSSLYIPCLTQLYLKCL